MKWFYLYHRNWPKAHQKCFRKTNSRKRLFVSFDKCLTVVALLWYLSLFGYVPYISLYAHLGIQYKNWTCSSYNKEKKQSLGCLQVCKLYKTTDWENEKLFIKKEKKDNAWWLLQQPLHIGTVNSWITNYSLVKAHKLFWDVHPSNKLGYYLHVGDKHDKRTRKPLIIYYMLCIIPKIYFILP